LGEGLEDLHALRIGMELGEAIMSMIRPQQWLAQFDVKTYHSRQQEMQRGHY